MRWLVVALLALAACNEGAPEGPTSRPASGTSTAVSGAWLHDVAEDWGVDFTYQSGGSDEHWFPEIMGGGAAVLDADGDGDLDLYFVQSGDLRHPGSGPPNRYFENTGEAARYKDATERSGLGHRGYGMGVTCGDPDGDGDVDVYVTNVGPNVLFENQGDGTFRDVTARAGVGHPGWGTSCAFVDVDGDARQDLFVVNNLAWSPQIEIDCFNYYWEKDYCSPNNYAAPAPDVLYRNVGDGTFQDVTEASGVLTDFGNGLGIAWADYDGDGRFDVYVANDAMPNQLWHNLGGGKFEDVAVRLGCAVNGVGAAEAGMGVQFVDVDQDGGLDLFMTHLRKESNTFYLFREGAYADVTPTTGTLGQSLRYTGFGTGFCDLDHDGVLDLYVANGAVQAWKPRIDPEDAYAEPNLLFRGKGGGKFEEIQGGEELLGTSRAAAFGDLDDDGDVDIVVVERDRPARVLRNDAEKKGKALTLELVDAKGSDALGARVRVTCGERVIWRACQAAYSYLASNDPRVHVGLGGAGRADEVRVYWPDGAEEVFGPLEAGELHVLRRGAGR